MHTYIHTYIHTIDIYLRSFGKDAAERALARIRNKLQGNKIFETYTLRYASKHTYIHTYIHRHKYIIYMPGLEDPTGEALGVEGQVDYLINDARNPSNLCRIFPGWAPWL